MESVFPALGSSFCKACKLGILKFQKTIIKKGELGLLYKCNHCNTRTEKS